MKFVVLLAVVGLASCLPTPYGDIEYSFIDSTGRLRTVELDSDDVYFRTAAMAPSAQLPAALPQPLSYMGVNALPAATPTATQYAQMTRYVYVDDDDLDDDMMYVQAAQPAAPSMGVMAYSAPAAAPAVAVAPAVPSAAVPAPILKAAPMPAQIQVVHKYKSDDDDDDSAEK